MKYLYIIIITIFSISDICTSQNALSLGGAIDRAHPFIARSAPDGRPLWERVYYTRHTSFEVDFLDNCHSVVAGYVQELSNGDLLVQSGFHHSDPATYSQQTKSGLMRVTSDGCFPGQSCEHLINITDPSVNSTRPSLFSPGYQWSLFDFSSFNLTGDLAGSTNRYQFNRYNELVGGDYYYHLQINDALSGDTTYQDTDLYLKERDSIIYFLNPDRNQTPNDGDEDYVLYDWSLGVGDTIEYVPILDPNEIDPQPYRLYVDRIDSVTLLNGERRKQWHFYSVEDPFAERELLTVVEGMGAVQGLFQPLKYTLTQIDVPGQPLVCYSLFDETLLGPIQSEYLSPDNCDFELTVSTKDRDNTSVHSIRIIPNPASDQIRIDGLEGGQVFIYDGAGRRVRVFSRATPPTVAGLPSGVYTVLVLSKDGRIGSGRIMVR